MDVDDWGDPIKPLNVPDYAKQRRSSDELREMQQRLLRAVSQPLEDSKKQPVAKHDLSPGVAPQPAEEVTAKDLEALIYELRDEWSAEKGEWDSTKMPVTVLAEKIMKRMRAYKRPGWGK